MSQVRMMIGHLNIGKNMTVDIFMVELWLDSLNISVICLCSYVIDMFF